jgi:hypothetical protein
LGGAERRALTRDFRGILDGMDEKTRIRLTKYSQKAG